MKRHLPLTLLGFLAFITLVSSLNPLLPLNAQSERKTGGTMQGTIARARTKPGGTGQGVLGKGDCPATELLLTALVPKTDQGVQGQTISERPTFWFYVPYTTAANFSARFSLQDEKGQMIYTTTRSLPASPGVVSIRLPLTAPALQVDQVYRWALQLECSRPELTVWGWVQRLELPTGTRTKIGALSTQQQAAFYQSNGLWLDALTVLGEARQTNPQNAAIANAWMSLITGAKLDLTPQNQAKLEEIARQPIVK